MLMCSHLGEDVYWLLPMQLNVNLGSAWFMVPSGRNFKGFLKLFEEGVTFCCQSRKSLPKAVLTGDYP